MEESAERGRLIVTISKDALRHPPAERDEFLRLACGNDTSLYRELVDVVKLEDKMKGFMQPSLLDLMDGARPFHPGQVVAEHFEIIREIGEGGMAFVYEAFHRKRQVRIAIKAAKPGFHHLLGPELEAALRVRHHNICLLYEPHTAQTEKGEIDFLTMELLDGETLSAYLLKHGRLSHKEALEIACQLCAGIAEAHASGIIHRDLKCANVILCRNNDGSRRAVITDFGLAGGQTLASGEIGGTPGYMAPELWRGGKTSKASDIYALGVILFEMVTASKPLPPEPSDEALTRGPAAPSALVPHLDPRWDRIVLQCLDPSPDLRPADAAQVAAVLTKTTFRKKLLLASVFALCMLILIVSLVPPLRQRVMAMMFPPPPEPISIVLADFTNATNDPVFDDTLKQALAIQLEQTPFLTVLSDRKVAHTLKLMNRPANERLINQVAEEVCLRTNSKSLLEGSIAAIGVHNLVTLKAVNCQTGETIASAAGEAENRDQVIRVLGQVGNQLRKKLGESRSSLEKFNVPLEEATTSSLEALQAFTQAKKVVTQGDRAIPFLKRAVELDPNFARAYTSLGVVYYNLDDNNSAIVNLNKAYELRDRVSQGERLVIEADHYVLVTGEIEKAIETYSTWIQAYPEASTPHANLGFIYAELGRCDKAVTEMQEAIRLSSDRSPFLNLAEAYACLGRPDDAQALLEQSRQQDRALFHELRYSFAFLQGDNNTMQEQLTWAMGKPEVEDRLLSAQSSTEAYYGRLTKARQLSEAAVQSATHARVSEAAAEWRATEALWEAEIGHAVRARKNAADALALSARPDVEVKAALALARAGDATRAQKLVDKLDRDLPVNTIIQNYWLPSIRAAIELEKKEPAKAIEQLKVAIPYELGGTSGYLSPVYIRGEAYLKAGQAQEAAREFQKILDHRGIVNNSITGALAHLQLGRAQAMLGDKEAARKSYQNFFALWRDGDPGIPILIQAKAEYARLR